jgi:hypothetical protein
MRAVTLVDLDDTLFQTRRKCPPDLPEDRLMPLAFRADGAPSSFATPRQQAFIGWLAETTHLVPVTARSRAALSRVRLPFAAAICAHGGMILDDHGTVDSEWDRHIRAEAARHAQEAARLVGALATAAQALGLAVAARMQPEGDIALYPLARHEQADEAALAQVAGAVAGQLPPGWKEHCNSNTVALLPPFLGKELAVARILPGLRARFPDAPVIGIGDSANDALFMHLCDFAMTPTGSQLAGLLGAGTRGTLPGGGA